MIRRPPISTLTDSPFPYTTPCRASFWLALLLSILCAVVLGWLPAGGMATVGDGSVLDRARYLVLPVLTLTVTSVGHFARFMRASMIQTLRQDYIRTARAKGVSVDRKSTRLNSSH